jgi:hypothetical protein
MTPCGPKRVVYGASENRSVASDRRLLSDPDPSRAREQVSRLASHARTQEPCLFDGKGFPQAVRLDERFGKKQCCLRTELNEHLQLDDASIRRYQPSSHKREHSAKELERNDGSGAGIRKRLWRGDAHEPLCEIEIHETLLKESRTNDDCDDSARRRCDHRIERRNRHFGRPERKAPKLHCHVIGLLHTGIPSTRSERIPSSRSDRLRVDAVPASSKVGCAPLSRVNPLTTASAVVIGTKLLASSKPNGMVAFSDDVELTR